MADKLVTEAAPRARGENASGEAARAPHRWTTGHAKRRAVRDRGDQRSPRRRPRREATRPRGGAEEIAQAARAPHRWTTGHAKPRPPLPAPFATTAPNEPRHGGPAGRRRDHGDQRSPPRRPRREATRA